MVDLWRDFWIRETGTGQQVAQLHDTYDDDDDDCDDVPSLRSIIMLQWLPGLFPGVKAAGARRWKTHLHLAPSLKKEYSYNFLPLWTFMASYGANITL